jgi:hypothetical protein
MPWKQDEPKWVPEEYPKMRVSDGQPNKFPKGHPRAGELMIFNSADEEAEFDGSKKAKK